MSVCVCVCLNVFSCVHVCVNVRSQLRGAGGGSLHAVAFPQQLEELLHRDPRVGGAPQGEHLPQQHPEGPAAKQ